MEHGPIPLSPVCDELIVGVLRYAQRKLLEASCLRITEVPSSDAQKAVLVAM